MEKRKRTEDAFRTDGARRVVGGARQKVGILGAASAEVRKFGKILILTLACGCADLAPLELV